MPTGSFFALANCTNRRHSCGQVLLLASPFLASASCGGALRPAELMHDGATIESSAGSMRWPQRRLSPSHASIAHGGISLRVIRSCTRARSMAYSLRYSWLTSTRTGSSSCSHLPNCCNALVCQQLSQHCTKTPASGEGPPKPTGSGYKGFLLLRHTQTHSTRVDRGRLARRGVVCATSG